MVGALASAATPDPIPIQLIPRNSLQEPIVPALPRPEAEVFQAITGGVELSLRQPYDFTLQDLEQGIADLFRLPLWLNSEVAKSSVAGLGVEKLKLGLIIFVAGFAVILFLLGWLTRRIGRTLIRIAEPFRNKAHEEFGSLLIYQLLTFARKNIFLPAALLIIWGVTQIVHLPRSLSVSVLAVLIALTLYMPLHHLLVMLYDPKGTGYRLVNLTTPSARRIYRWLQISASSFVFPLLAIFLLKFNGYRQPAIEFLQFASRLLLTASAAWALVFRRTLFAWEHPPTVGPAKFLYQLAFRLYYPFVIGLLLLFGAAAGGYRNFSNFILGRVGLVGAVIVGAFAARKILHDLIRNRIRSLARDEVARFHSGEEKIVESLRPTLETVVRWGLPIVAFILLGRVLHLSWEVLGLGGLHSFLVTPFVKAASTEISIASMTWAAVVFILFMTSGRVLRGALSDFVFPLMKMDEGMRYAISTCLNYIIILIGLMMALGTIGIGWQTLTVFVGALGVGLGFGLQRLVNNFVSGVTLLFEQPIRRGDFLEIGDKRGIVHKIGSRGTVIATRDNAFLIVPNSEIMEKTFTNWSYQDLKTRVRIPFSIAYGSDLKKVDRVVLEIAGSIAGVLKKPAASVILKNFGASSLDFELQVWVSDPTISVTNEINRAIEEKFRSEKIEMPFPQSEIHFRS